ncbi:MAG: proliferating cell nuclear antigen (pcna) [Aigarchaeota archaeon]|nr:proliferating cell nuclear antigen (pcna) [Aigarchaeota archaeon]
MDVVSFKMKIPNAKNFADLINAVSAVVEEGTFRVNESAMTLAAMDPAHISLVDFEFQKAGAEEFFCEKPVEISVSITELLKFLKRARGSEGLELSYDAERRRLTISFADPSLSTERTFTVGALETAGERPPSPKLTFDARARMEVDVFKDAVDDSMLVSDYVKVTISPSGVVLAAKGELGTSQTKVVKTPERTDTALYDLQAEAETSAHFSINYLSKILRAAAAVSKELTVELSSSKPIRLDFTIPAGHLTYLIAPRIESA